MKATPRLYGAPEDNFLIQHGEYKDGTSGVQVEIGTESVGVWHTFTDPDILSNLGAALGRAGEALRSRQGGLPRV